MENQQGMCVTGDTDDVPGHILVQEQLRDLVLQQQKTIDCLREELNAKRNMIPRDHYEALVKDLEDERISHAKTKRQLMDLEDKLAFTEGEVKILKKRLEEEKEQFSKISSMLRNKALRETKKNVELSNKCHEISLQKEEEENIIRIQTERLEALSAELKAEKAHHQQHLMECELQKKQQAYINEIMKEKDEKILPLLHEKNSEYDYIRNTLLK